MKHLKQTQKFEKNTFTKKFTAIILSVLLVISAAALTVTALEKNVDLGEEDGRLKITEEGTYTLTGKLDGCVYVDPGEGDVTLILDGADIFSEEDAGIVAVSGDSLTIELEDDSINRVQSEGNGNYQSVIYSKVDTVFDGGGSLYVTGNNLYGIRTDKTEMTFKNGIFAIKANMNAVSAGTSSITVNDGHYSIQAQNSFDPNSKLFMNGGVVEEVETDTASSDTSSNSTSSYVTSDDSTSETVSSQQGYIYGSSESSSNYYGDYSDQNGEMPQNGEMSQNGEMPQNGEMFQNGEMPQNGEMSQNSGMPQNGQMNSSQTFNGQTSGGQSFDEGQIPEDGQMPDNSEFGQLPGNMNSTVTGTTDSASDVVLGTMTNSAADLEADYENATYITVTDEESDIVITSSGTYVVTGSSSDGNITVKKGTTGVVLILEDLDLTSTTGATVSVNKEAEVKIIISGEVVLTDNENPEDEDSADEEVADAYDGAALKVKDGADVYVTGDGTLTINGNAKNGIKAGDDSTLIIDEVTVNISAVNDGINSSYDVTLLGGTFNIEAGDDAIHADHILTVGSEDGTGPVINVTESTEGLEGTVVNILGGDISIVSSDDAINAANGDGTYEGELDYSFNMLGGEVVINSVGDGIDSNGDVNLIDGSAEIHSGSAGGEAGIDYVGDLYISEDYELNNQSGVASDSMMGGQPGQMNNQQYGPQQNSSNTNNQQYGPQQNSSNTNTQQYGPSMNNR